MKTCLVVGVDPCAETGVVRQEKWCIRSFMKSVPRVQTDRETQIHVSRQEDEGRVAKSRKKQMTKTLRILAGDFENQSGTSEVWNWSRPEA